MTLPFVSFPHSLVRVSEAARLGLKRVCRQGRRLTAFRWHQVKTRWDDRQPAARGTGSSRARAGGLLGPGRHCREKERVHPDKMSASAASAALSAQSAALSSALVEHACESGASELFAFATVKENQQRGYGGRGGCPKRGSDPAGDGRVWLFPWQVLVSAAHPSRGQQRRAAIGGWCWP